MANYAVVKDNVVLNLVEWDGITEYSVPEGDLILSNGDGFIGGAYDNGVFSPKPVAEDTFTYSEKRIGSYGSIGDQLDMQYWDSVNDTTTWKDHIASVKAQFPKV